MVAGRHDRPAGIHRWLRWRPSIRTTGVFAHRTTRPEGKGTPTRRHDGPRLSRPSQVHLHGNMPVAIVKHLPGQLIARRIPVLQAIYPQYRLYRHRRAPALVPALGQCGTISASRRPQDNAEPISVRNRSRHLGVVFIASMRPGKAVCQGISKAPRRRCSSLSDHAGNGRFFRRSLT